MFGTIGGRSFWALLVALYALGVAGGRGDPVSRGVYGSSRWRRVRRLVLDRDEYLCQVRGERCEGHASCVDHVKPVRVAPELAFELGNLRASCNWCNNMRAVDDREGRGDVHERFKQRRAW